MTRWSRDWTTWNVSLRLKAQCDIRIAPVINGDEVQQLFYLTDMTFWLEQNDLIHDELPTSSPDATGRSKHEQMAHSAPVTSLIHKLLPICWSLSVRFILKDFSVENLLLSENPMAIKIHPWCAVERSTCVHDSGLPILAKPNNMQIPNQMPRPHHARHT